MQGDNSEIIRSFTKDDYLSPDGAPFKWLFDQRSDPFAYQRLRNMMADAAKEQGVKGFAGLLKAFAESQMTQNSKRTAEMVTENVTDFSNFDVELRCGPYDVNDFGITVDGPYGVIQVSQRPVVPVRRLVNIDTGEVKIELAYKHSGRWSKNIFDKGTLSSARSIVELSKYGIDVNSETARELVKYISYMEEHNYAQIHEDLMVDHLGWVDDKQFSPYIDGILYDHGGKFDDMFKAVREGGSFDEWLKLAKQVRAGHSLPTRIALAAAFAAPLVKRLDALPFIVHFWGSISGVGKSVALVLAASVYAYPEIGYYAKTTKSTDVGLEQMASFTNNMPLCLDELQLIQRAAKDFDSIVYTLCEGVGKSRGSRTGGLQATQRWSNCIITTGEQPIISAGSKAGATNRVIEVEVTDKTFDDPRAAYQTLVANYGFAGKMFIARFADSDAMDVARDAFDSFYEALRGKGTDKQVLSMAIILTADYLANLWIFDDGNSLEPEDVEQFLLPPDRVDTNVRAHEWIMDWISENHTKFVDLAEGEIDRRPERWGVFKHPGNDPTHPPECCYIIPSVFREKMTDRGFSPDSYLSWAKKEGKIRTDKDRANRYTVTHRIRKGAPLSKMICVIMPSEDEPVGNKITPVIVDDLPF